jgi:hypothetical protein
MDDSELWLATCLQGGRTLYPCEQCFAPNTELNDASKGFKQRTVKFQQQVLQNCYKLIMLGYAIGLLVHLVTWCALSYLVDLKNQERQALLQWQGHTCMERVDNSHSGLVTAGQQCNNVAVFQFITVALIEAITLS